MPFNAADMYAEATARRDDAPPDGFYDVDLIDSTIITANATGRQSLKLTWKVLTGAQRDESWSTLHTLERYRTDGELSGGLGVTTDMLRKMGLTQLDEPSESPNALRNGDDLRAAVRQLHGRSYHVEVKRSGQWTNTNVRGTLEVTASGYSTQPVADNPQVRDVQRTGQTDIPVESSSPPQQGDIDPETGDPIPF
jgi:hypothetical protein